MGSYPSLSEPVVTLGFTQNTFQGSEDQTYVEVCVNISDVPAGGLECDVEAGVSILNSTKAGGVQFCICV